MILVKILNTEDYKGPELFICQMDEEWSLGTVAHAYSFDNKGDAEDAVQDFFKAFPRMENPYSFVNIQSTVVHD